MWVHMQYFNPQKDLEMHMYAFYQYHLKAMKRHIECDCMDI